MNISESKDLLISENKKKKEIDRSNLPENESKKGSKIWRGNKFSFRITKFKKTKEMDYNNNFPVKLNNKKR